MRKAEASSKVCHISKSGVKFLLKMWLLLGILWYSKLSVLGIIGHHHIKWQGLRDLRLGLCTNYAETYSNMPEHFLHGAFFNVNTLRYENAIFLFKLDVKEGCQKCVLQMLDKSQKDDK